MPVFESVDRNRVNPICEVQKIPCAEYRLEIMCREAEEWPSVLVFGRQGNKRDGWGEWIRLAESTGWGTLDGALEEAALILRALVVTKQPPL